jgi:hypothetical protein
VSSDRCIATTVHTNRSFSPAHNVWMPAWSSPESVDLHGPAPSPRLMSTDFESVLRVYRQVTARVAGCRNNGFELCICSRNADDWDCCVTAEIGTFLLLLRYLLRYALEVGGGEGRHGRSRRAG